MAKGGKQPVLRLGGDARGATKAMTTVRMGLVRVKNVAVRIGRAMKTALMAPFKALKFGFGMIGRMKYHLMGLIAIGGLALRASIKQKLATRTLQMAVDAAGYSWDVWGKKIIKTLNAMQKLTNYGDEEMAPMFNQLLLAGMKPKKMLEDMPRILDLCAAAGYDMASGSEYIARAWTGEYTILKRNLPVIAGLITAMDVRKKVLGRELTQLEKWNMMMDMATSKLSGLAAETRKINPFPALLNEIGDNLEKVGDFLAIHVNPKVRELTNFFGKLKEVDAGKFFNTLWNSLKDIKFWKQIGATAIKIAVSAIKFIGQILAAELLRAVVLAGNVLKSIFGKKEAGPEIQQAGMVGGAFRLAGKMPVKKMAKFGAGTLAVGMGIEYAARSLWDPKQLRISKDMVKRLEAQAFLGLAQDWGTVKSMIGGIAAPFKAAWPGAAPTGWEAFGQRWRGRGFGEPKYRGAALTPEQVNYYQGRIDQVMMGRFLMNQTTAQHRGVLPSVI